MTTAAPPPAQGPRSKSKKAWYFRWWAWAIAALIVVGGIGAALGGHGQKEADAPAATTAPIPKASIETVPVPDVSGEAGDEARTALTAAGFTVKFVADSGETVIAASNWTVVSTEPDAGATASKGQTVTVHVMRKPAPTPTVGVDVTEAGLDKAYAEQACAKAGKQAAYPDKLTANWATDSIAGMVDKKAWQVKIDSTLKSASGAKAHVYLVCTVSGTNDAPSVDKTEVDPAG